MTGAPAPAGAAPALGFIGWGPESEALLDAVRAAHPQAAAEACLLTGSGPNPTGLRTVPTLEALFRGADTLVAAGGMDAVAPHLPMMRLAISDRHVVLLVGAGWNVPALLEHLRDRKLARCVLLPAGPERMGVLAYYAAPFFAPGELATLEGWFAGVDLIVPLAREAHVDVLQALGDFAPAAFATLLEAMADGMATMGLGREAVLKVLATLLHGATARLLAGQATPAELRAEALEREVAAAGLVELEAAGLRGHVMRAIREAVGHAAAPGRARPTDERD